MTQVVYTAAAERDLTEIGDAIAADDPLSALAFVESVRGPLFIAKHFTANGPSTT